MLFPARADRLAEYVILGMAIPGHDGMIHISKLGTDRKVNSVEDVLSVGDKVNVEIIKIGEKGIDLKLLSKVEG